MRAPPKRAWQTRYAVAVLVTVAAVVCQWLIQPYIPPSPMLLFDPAILLAAWFGGFGPGAVSVALSSAALVYLFLPPTSTFTVAAPENLLDLVIFAAMGLAVSALMAGARAATRNANVARLEAEAARAHREEMLAILSHDLRTPLMSILLTCAQIERALPSGMDGRVSAWVERIQRSARRMQALVANLLTAATIDAGALTLQTAEIEVAELLESTATLFQPIAEKKSIRFVVRAATTERLTCDRERILQTLDNLVGNALKFVPAHGEVELSASSEPDAVVFAVRDSGPGMPPEQLGRIFDRYWKGEGGRGSGLGLYIAKAVVEAHGGRIWATGGHGTTVAFTLPRRAAGPVSGPLTTAGGART